MTISHTPDHAATFNRARLAMPTEAENWLNANYPPFFQWSEATAAQRVEATDFLEAHYVPVYGFPGITGDALLELSEVPGVDRIVEIGAGSGYLTWEMRRRGFDVAPTDPRPWCETPYGDRDGGKQWVDTAVANHLTVVQSVGSEYNLLLSWPAGQARSTDVPLMFAGRYIIYIPEMSAHGRVPYPIDDALSAGYNLVALIGLFPVWSDRDVLEVWERADYSADRRPMAERRFQSATGGGRRVPQRQHE